MILPQFLRKFDYMFKDPDIKFVADLKMVAMLMSSLKLEPVESLIKTQGYILPIDTLSTGIYFINKGVITVKYQNSGILCRLDDGSYFGEISYLFSLRNQYKFEIEASDCGHIENVVTIFSI